MVRRRCPPEAVSVPSITAMSPEVVTAPSSPAVGVHDGLVATCVVASPYFQELTIEPGRPVALPGDAGKTWLLAAVPLTTDSALTPVSAVNDTPSATASTARAATPRMRKRRRRRPRPGAVGLEDATSAPRDEVIVVIRPFVVVPQLPAAALEQGPIDR